MTAPSPLDVRPRPPADAWRTSRQPRANKRRVPLCDGGPAMPGHYRALLAVADGLVRREPAHGVDGCWRWHWVGWTRVRVYSPLRRYLVELERAGMVEGAEPVKVTEAGAGLLEELRERWSR